MNKGRNHYYSLEEWCKKLPTLSQKDLTRAEMEISIDLKNRRERIRFKQTESGESHWLMDKEDIKTITLLEEHLKALREEEEKRRG
jgi:hypothetical protein